jgi:hypothetical protein
MQMGPECINGAVCVGFHLLGFKLHLYGGVWCMVHVRGFNCRASFQRGSERFQVGKQAC